MFLTETIQYFVKTVIFMTQEIYIFVKIRGTGNFPAFKYFWILCRCFSCQVLKYHLHGTKNCCCGTITQCKSLAAVLIRWLWCGSIMLKIKVRFVTDFQLCCGTLEQQQKHFLKKLVGKVENIPTTILHIL